MIYFNVADIFLGGCTLVNGISAQYVGNLIILDNVITAVTFGSTAIRALNFGPSSVISGNTVLSTLYLYLARLLTIS